MAKILIVDDDIELTELLKDYLSLEGHVVDTTSSGEDALQILRGFVYDLILLDLFLPGISGEAVCRGFRSKGGQAAIIFLTGKRDLDTLESVLDSGGDDYVGKPFHPREVAARIRAALRRSPQLFAAEIRIGDLTLIPTSNLAIARDGEIRLRQKETALLEYLMRHPNQTFSAQQLFDAVWSSESEGTSDAVRTWIRYLRKRLATIGQGDLIKTMLGSGYTIEDRQT